MFFWQLWLRLKSKKMVVAIVFLLFVLFSLFQRDVDDDGEETSLYGYLRPQLKERLCQQPKLEPNSPVVRKHSRVFLPPVCSAENKWVFLDKGKLYVNVTVADGLGEIDCNFTEFWRKSDAEYFESLPKPISKSGSGVKRDFVSVNCSSSTNQTFKHVYAQIWPRKMVLERLKNRHIKERNGNVDRLNIYFLGFDSVSHMAFRRLLPKVYKHLTHHLGAVVLSGYNIVGVGTTRALVPMLTGHTEEEMPEAKYDRPNSTFVDLIYPLIWKNFSHSYITLFAEEFAAGTFTYRLKGFKNQPTDHFFWTFWMKIQSEFGLGYCLGSETRLSVWFRYFEEFFKNYPSSLPKFLFSIHDHLSHDDAYTIRLAQDDLLDHLKRLENQHVLDRTLLIVFADHGSRVSPYRGTQRGKLEERLPFFSIVAPKWWRDTVAKEAWHNLQTNADRLTTPFDIYATIRDLLLSPDGQLSTHDWPPYGPKPHRAISLWTEVPLNRDCRTADIPLHWCTCLNWENADATAKEVTIAANVVLEKIVQQTESYRAICVKFEIKKIITAKKLAPHKDLMR